MPHQLLWCIAGKDLTRADGTVALVIVPTRELAAQTGGVLERLLRPHPTIVAGAVTGGVKRKSEKARLRRGIAVLVGTPGRLLDHLRKTASWRVENCRWLVLDEADRLADMGFEQDIRAIVEKLDSAAGRRQTVLLSATLGDGAKRLASLGLTKPLVIDATASEAAASLDMTSGKEADPDLVATVHMAPEGLSQSYVVVPAKQRLVTLLAALSQLRRAVIFFSSRDSVDFHYHLLREVTGYDSWKGVSTLHRLHSGLSQAERLAEFAAFQKCGDGFLLCTDVAARGLDISDVEGILQVSI